MGCMKVLLVDDQVLFVESLRTVLETRAEDIEVVGVAADGLSAVALTAVTQPDVILMDVRMPGMSGVEATRFIKERDPAIKIIMLTTFDDDQYVIDALRLGAAGYLLKDIPPLELIAAVRLVYNGGVLIAPRVATKLVNRLTGPVYHQPAVEEAPPKPASAPASASTGAPACLWVHELSDREKAILRLMAKGLDNRGIAGQLFIAEQTVKNHISVIYSKLGVRDRVQATRMVIEAGLEE